MSITAEVDGSIRSVKNLYTNIDGTMRKIKNVYANTDGNIKKVFSASNGYVTYGVKISLSTYNPSFAVAYTDDAVGMDAGSGLWDIMPIFSDIRPCVLKDGEVTTYLSKSNFQNKSNGAAIGITSILDGDVMIEFPIIGIKISKWDGFLDVKITNDPNADGFSYAPFLRPNQEKRKLYIGAFLGCVEDGKLRSVSGKQPTRSQTIDAFYQYAAAKGDGYSLFSFYALTLLQCLYLIRFKNLDSQTVCGYGASNTNGGRYSSGNTKDKAMFYPGTDEAPQNKVFGIEDLWGNLKTYIDGIRSSGYNYVISKNHTNAESEEADIYPSTFSSSSTSEEGGFGRFIADVCGTNELGFLISNSDTKATDSTLFCDAGSFYTDRIAILGGGGSGAKKNGIFSLGISIKTIDNEYYPYSDTSARLMYL
ncbi:MAG: hypothetical protein J5922_05240 [Clostridia bacterium]|nr:hypothetical protein [Clostridia bacterium]